MVLFSIMMLGLACLISDSTDGNNVMHHNDIVIIVYNVMVLYVCCPDSAFHVDKLLAREEREERETEH